MRKRITRAQSDPTEMLAKERVQEGSKIIAYLLDFELDPAEFEFIDSLTSYVNVDQLNLLRNIRYKYASMAMPIQRY